MGNKLNFVFKVIIVFGVYHLVRDILQIVGIETLISQIGKRPHEWCNPFGIYCEYLSLPIDLLMIIGPLVVIKRQKSGILGVAIFLSIAVLLLMWFLK